MRGQRGRHEERIAGQALVDQRGGLQPLFGIGGQLQVVLHQGGLEAGSATAVLPVRLLQQLPAARERAGGQHAGYVDDHRGGFLSVA